MNSEDVRHDERKNGVEIEVESGVKNKVNKQGKTEKRGANKQKDQIEDQTDEQIILFHYIGYTH